MCTCDNWLFGSVGTNGYLTMGIKFTDEAKAAMRINLILLSTYMCMDLLQISSFPVGFIVGMVNYLYVVNELKKIKS
jgi:hypothetical protein